LVMAVAPCDRAVEGGIGRRPHARPTAAAAGEAGGFNAVQKLFTTGR
jgi:hypothetical protein